VGISIFVGTDYEHETLLNLANLVNECEEYGIPVMAVTVWAENWKKGGPLSCLVLSHRCELGARVVKTYWCEDFEKVVDSCPVPVVMAGGPKCKTDLEVFELSMTVCREGPIGLNLGRNVWQNEHPVAMARALRAIIHENATAQEAQNLFDSIKSGKQ